MTDRETAELKQQNQQLRARLEQLEGRLRELEELERAAAQTNDRYRSLVDQLALDVADVLGSARWRVGNALIRLVEVLLGRPRTPLLLHHMQDLLERYRKLNQGRWKLSGSRPAALAPAAMEVAGQPMADELHDSTFADSTFARVLAGIDISQVERSNINDALETELDEIQALVATARLPAGDPPLVSVIMPAFNRQELVVEAISSVLDQSYPHWELWVCDDGSSDGTRDAAAGFGDPRIRVLKLQHAGAAAARNAGLDQARGQIMAYLDSDNIWHPQYLAVMVATLLSARGRYCAYSAYLDLEIRADHARLKAARSREFRFDELAEKNFVDLNGFAHWRELFDCFGGFTKSLPRQQDWDLVLKYSFPADPLVADFRLVLYRRNEDWNQLTRSQKHSNSHQVVQDNLAGYYRNGLPIRSNTESPRVSVLVWDICRNHFSKAYNIAEALSENHEVELVGFRFFESEIFEPYAGVQPGFATHYIDGADFPGFFGPMREAMACLSGDLIYCVKPRLPSLGLALLNHYHRGTPFVVECNDLESVVSNPDRESEGGTEVIDPADPDLLCPHHATWTRYLEQLVRRLPLPVTHNENLNQWLGGHCLFQRNIKDQQRFDPAHFDRAAVRARLGYSPAHRVILFSGLVRRHKGIFELQQMLELAPDTYRLLVIGSRRTPDLERLQREHSGQVQILPPVDRNGVAELTLAADAVVLWLDPGTPASHYQMPFKLTDALAMGVPVFANQVSDLAELIRQHSICHTPYGNARELIASIESLYADPEAAAALQQRARNLYLRQFSYQAARSNFEIIKARLAGFPAQIPAAAEFAETLDRFRRSIR